MAHAICWGVALVIGLARGIVVIMEQGLIVDTILHFAAETLGDLSSIAFIRGHVRDRDL